MNKWFIYAAFAIICIVVVAAVFWKASPPLFKSEAETASNPTPSPSPTSTFSPATSKQTANATFSGLLNGGYTVTYCSNKTITVNGQVPWGSDCTLDLTYSVDDSQTHPVSYTMTQLSQYKVAFSGSIDVSHLSAGEHTVVVYGQLSWAGVLTSSATLNFTASPTPNSTPTLIPELETFSTTATASFDIPSSNYKITYYANKTLTLNGQALWNPDCSLEVTCSLDGAGLKTIPCVIKPLPAMMGYAISFSGYLDLSQLIAGEHSITVYGRISWTKVSSANTTLNFIAQ